MEKYIILFNSLMYAYKKNKYLLNQFYLSKIKSYIK